MEFQPHIQAVTLAGETLYVRELTLGDILDMRAADESTQPLLMIQRSLCNADGSPRFQTTDGVRQLPVRLFSALVAHIEQAMDMDQAEMLDPLSVSPTATPNDGVVALMLQSERP